MERKQYLVLGLGIFGSTVAKTLSEFGHEVLAVDRDAECVHRMQDIVTEAVQADFTDIEQLREIGAADFDVAVIATGSDLEISTIALINLKELGVPYIIAKARNKTALKILEKLGADRIVRPDKEIGERVAKSLLRSNISDMIDIDDETSIVDFIAPEEWVGKSVSQLDLRNQYGINILGIRARCTNKLNLDFGAGYVVQDGDKFLIIAATKTLEKYDYLAKI